MQLKYLFFHVSLYLFGLVIASKSDSHVEEMNILWSKPVWKAMVEMYPTAGIMDNGIFYNLSDLIEPDGQGAIVSESNVSDKIRQYFTLLSFTYSQWLNELRFFFHYLNEKSSVIQKHVDYHRVFLQLIADHGLMLTKMKSSLELIKSMVDINDQPIENVEIIRAINSLCAWSHNVARFIRNVDQCASLVEKFINRNLGERGYLLNLKPAAAQKVIAGVDNAFNINPELPSITLNLQDYIQKKVKEFNKDFELFGFGYRNEEAYVKKDSMLKIIFNNLRNLSISVRLSFLEEE